MERWLAGVLVWVLVWVLAWVLVWVEHLGLVGVFDPHCLCNGNMCNTSSPQVHFSCSACMERVVVRSSSGVDHPHKCKLPHCSRHIRPLLLHLPPRSTVALHSHNLLTCCSSHKCKSSNHQSLFAVFVSACRHWPELIRDVLGCATASFDLALSNDLPPHCKHWRQYQKSWVR